MKKIAVNGKEYEVVEEKGERLNEEELEKYLTEYFDDYDYVLGDYSYEKLRLKGFCNKENKKVTPINNINTKDDYLKNLCTYHADYFLLKKINK